MGKEIERGWRYGGMGQRGLVHISLVKMLSLLFGFDMHFDLIITYLCVSGWRELCDELPLSGHQVKKNHLKHHATLWVMPLYVYRREDISISLMRTLDQSIPTHVQTYEMVYPGKRPSCNSLYLHHPWPKATQAAGEQGTLWWAGSSCRMLYSSAEMPLEKRSFIKIVICYHFHPHRGCLLLGRHHPRGRERLWNIHTSEEITFVSVDCGATTGWRGEQGKNNWSKGERKKGQNTLNEKWAVISPFWNACWASPWWGASQALPELISGGCRDASAPVGVRSMSGSAHVKWIDFFSLVRDG